MRYTKFSQICNKILHGDERTIYSLVYRYSGRENEYHRINKKILNPKKAEWKRKAYNKNPEKERVKARIYYSNNIILNRSKARKRMLKAFRKNIRLYKAEVLKHYGNDKLACVCCGVDILEMLTLDHINGRNKEEKKNQLHAYHLYKHLRTIYYKTNQWPEGFRTLCFNCNSGRQINKGICPHEIIKLDKPFPISENWSRSSNLEVF